MATLKWQAVVEVPDELAVFDVGQWLRPEDAGRIPALAWYQALARWTAALDEVPPPGVEATDLPAWEAAWRRFAGQIATSALVSKGTPAAATDAQ